VLSGKGRKEARGGGLFPPGLNSKVQGVKSSLQSKEANVQAGTKRKGTENGSREKSGVLLGLLRRLKVGGVEGTFRGEKEGYCDRKLEETFLRGGGMGGPLMSCGVNTKGTIWKEAVLVRNVKTMD